MMVSDVHAPPTDHGNGNISLCPCPLPQIILFILIYSMNSTFLIWHTMMSCGD